MYRLNARALNPPPNPNAAARVDADAARAHIRPARRPDGREDGNISEESPGSTETRVPGNARRVKAQGQCNRERPPKPGVAGFPRETRPARVKRWGKSPPRTRQRGRHGKPHPEQDQIGAARPGESPGTSVSGPPPGSVARDRQQWRSERNGRRRPATGATEPGLQAVWRFSLLLPQSRQTGAARRRYPFLHDR